MLCQMACAKTRLAEKEDIFIVQILYPGVVLTGQVYLYWKSFTEVHFYTNFGKFSFQVPFVSGARKMIVPRVSPMSFNNEEFHRCRGKLRSLTKTCADEIDVEEG